MASSDDYHEFELKLMARCYSENSRRYAEAHIPRFLQTFDLIKRVVPKDEGKLNVLDIGPFLPFTLTCKEVLEDSLDRQITTTVIELPSEEKQRNISDVPAVFVNIEQQIPDLDPDSFDLVFMLEILEHFSQDPFHAVSQVHRLLKEGGFLVLSTPNVASLDKRLRLAFGRNIYDVYSKESAKERVYGRHNREYTLAEVKELLSGAALEVIDCHLKVIRNIEASFYRRPLVGSYYLLSNLLTKAGLNVGNYIFCVARKIEKQPEFPQWLYRHSAGLQTMFK